MYSGKGDEMRILVLSLALLILGSLPVQGDVAVKQMYVAPTPYITGYFGGLKPDNIFKLLLSLHGGVRFYRINPDNASNYARMPLNTPVRILVDGGLVTSVEVMGGQQ